ncbi:hypothetical protein O3P69_016212, partial [Scylla paramamosain]
MASSSHSCSGCGKEVRPRQHALLCDNCHQWRHRVCDTNMTQEMYRRINKELKEGGSFDWTCPECPKPHHSPISSACQSPLDHSSVSGACQSTPNAATPHHSPISSDCYSTPRHSMEDSYESMTI